jgi:hypothetical protein
VGAEAVVVPAHVAVVAVAVAKAAAAPSDSSSVAARRESSTRISSLTMAARAVQVVVPEARAKDWAEVPAARRVLEAEPGARVAPEATAGPVVAVVAVRAE